MNEKVNYDKKMQEIIATLKTENLYPALLLHSCCAPCSSSVILKLAGYFDITVFYYNPNIDTAEEYTRRSIEQRRLIEIYNNSNISKTAIKVIIEDYDNRDFFTVSKNLENCEEGGARCLECYSLRIKNTSEKAKKENYDFFATTLSVSPHKNAQMINKIGFSFSTEKCRWLPNDFKKRNGYVDSVQLSKKYGLYRQDYCGCIYSLNKNKLD